MSLKLRKVNAEVRDPETDEMIPAGLLGSDAVSTIEEARDQAIEAVEEKGEETLASIPDDYSTLSGDVGELKTQIDNVADGAIIKNSVSGSIITVNDAIDGMPLKEAVIDIIPRQDGSGDPSSENVRPITGYNSINVYRTGKNLWGGLTFAQQFAGTYNYNLDTTAKTFTYVRRGGSSGESTIIDSGFKPNTRYTIIITASADAKNTCLRVNYTDNSTVTTITIDGSAKTTHRIVTNANKTVRNIALGYNQTGTVTVYYDESGIFEGEINIADFEQYTGETVGHTLENTIYGGRLNLLTGELEEIPGYIASYDGETLVGPWISSMDVYDEEVTPTTGAQVFDFGAQKTATQVAALNINMISGICNVWSNCGYMSIVYFRPSIDYIDARITEESTKLQEKTYGLSSDALLYMSEIPTYYTVANETPSTYSEASAYIEDKIASIPDGKHFIFITDTHWQNNAKHSTQLINYVRKRTGIKKVMFGGDLTNYAGNKYLGKRIAGEYMYQIRRAFGKDLLPIVGDHDNNMAYNEMTAEQYPDYYVPYQQLVPIFMDDVKHIYHGADYSTKLLDYATGDDYAELVAFFKSVYYVDDISDKIRYIVLNCGTSAPQYGSIYNVFGITPNIEVLRLQYDWLFDTLMSTPEGYDVAVCSHKIAFTSTPGNIALGMIRAFKDKTPMTQSTYTAGNEKMEAWWPHNKGYNFAGAPTVGKVFTVNGHIHYDMISYSKLGSDNKWNYHTAYNGEVLNQATSAEIPSIFTTTDSVGRWQDAPAADRVPMELGTVTEQAFDVYTIVDDGIVLTRFGAGNDRRIYINT